MTEDDLLAAVRRRVAAGARAALGVLGGTFDPIHAGHVRLAEAARAQLDLDGMLYVPAGVPSFKRSRRIAPGGDRLAMARLAVEGLPLTAVSAREVDRPGVTYAVDTLEELAVACGPGVRLVFVTGSDVFATLPFWHRARRVAELAEFAVAARPGAEPVDSAERRLREAGFALRWRALAGDFPVVSSSEVRADLERGRLAPGLLDPKVSGYICERGLYGTASQREDACGER